MRYRHANSVSGDYIQKRIEEEINMNPNTKMIVDNIKKMILG